MPGCRTGLGTLICCCLCLSLGAMDPGVYEAARRLQVQPLDVQPSWAGSVEVPLLRVAWISDCHLDGRERTRIVTRGLHVVRDVIRPDLVVVTGDNSGDAGPARAAGSRPVAERRQMVFRDLLAKELGLPAAIIPGDNWPWGFEAVFGPSTFSFVAAGVQFVFLSVDARARGVEGCAIFLADTWEWLDATLVQAKGRPTLVLTHETTVPPSFLDAGRLERALLAHPHVLATMTGHLHLDLEFRRQGLTHVVAPSMGVGTPPAFKTLTLYRDRLVFDSYEYDAAADTFLPARKWRKLDIPEALRQALHPVDRGTLRRVGRREMPPRPLAELPALRDRQAELVFPMLQFVLGLGRQVLENDGG